MEIIRQFTNTETKRSCISSHMYGVFWSIYASAEFCWSMKKVVNHIWHTSHGSATTLLRALNGMGITTFGSRIWKRNCDVLYKAENHHLKMIISLNPSCLHFFFQSRQGNGKTEWQSGNNSWTFFMNLNGMSPIRVRDCFRSAGIVSGCSWNGDLKKEATGPISSYFWETSDILHRLKLGTILLTAWKYVLYVCVNRSLLRKCCRKGET